MPLYADVAQLVEQFHGEKRPRFLPTLKEIWEWIPNYG